MKRPDLAARIHAWAHRLRLSGNSHQRRVRRRIEMRTASTLYGVPV